MNERLYRHPSRLGKAFRLGVAGVLLAVPVTASRTNASETTVSNQPIYVNLPDWKCDPRNDVRFRDRNTENFTRPDTSVTSETVSVTYPVDEQGGTVYQTIIYENPSLQTGQILRYYSDSRDCPLPDGAPTIQ